ncbi:NADH dehydrogenase 1 alpha subcomplex assembly factor 3 [Geranomyces variabilis]|nr:NADH dehydrogenase 1 alpha subcomplex assembly factor 3 [Geranomyces variabilis]KAJ3135732.1 hypothetical protein HDU90_003808 [Geranomyces variabilis]
MSSISIARTARAVTAVPRSRLIASRVSRRPLRAITCRHISSQNSPPSERLDPLVKYNIFPTSSAEPASSKLFSAVGNTSFTVGDLRMHGPVVVINDQVLMWDVPQFGVGSDEVVSALDASTAQDGGAEVVLQGDPSSPFYGWGVDCFKIFEVIEQQPEILVIGTGAQTYPLPPHLKAYLHKLGMQVEVLASRQAGSTYNILVQEGRRPAAALLPVVPTSARMGQVLVKFKQPPKVRDELEDDDRRR